MAGYIFGIKFGLIIIFFADFLSCSLSFFIARRLGRDFLLRFLGSRQMIKIEGFSNKYLERNFFLMCGFLMTQFFDFVCYAIGLTKIKWQKFAPALIISILISDAPFVSIGNAIKSATNISIKEIINGNIQLNQGPYLMILMLRYQFHWSNTSIGKVIMRILFIILI